MLLDFDNDGDLDVLLVQGALLDPTKTMHDASFPPSAEAKPGARLFRNELIPAGKLRFTDVTKQAGVDDVRWSTSGSTEQWTTVQADKQITLRQNTGKAETKPTAPSVIRK